MANQLNNNYGFIQNWKPGETDKAITKYYAAAYIVVKTLAEENGGLKFYKKFFQQIQDLSNITNTEIAIHYLNKAAGKDLTTQFEEWGFKTIDIYEIRELIEETKEILRNKIFFQPWTWIAEGIINNAEKALNQGATKMAMIELTIGRLIAESAITLTIITIGIIMIFIVRGEKIE